MDAAIACFGRWISTINRVVEAVRNFRDLGRALALSATLHVLALSFVSVGSPTGFSGDSASPIRLDAVLRAHDESLPVVLSPLPDLLETSDTDPSSDRASSPAAPELAPDYAEKQGLLPDIAKIRKPRLLTPLELDGPDIQSVARAIRLRFTLSITATGEVSGVTLDSSFENGPGTDELVRQLMLKLAGMRFKPAEEGGVPIPSSTTLDIVIEENRGDSSLNH